MSVNVNTYLGWSPEQKRVFEDWLEFHGYNVIQAKVYQVDFPEGANGYFIVTRYGDEGKSVLEKVEMKTPPPTFV